jgi:hypothetical protein
VERAADLVVSYGGSLSGEHGDGQSRGALLPKMFGPELMNAFREFKAVWDPHNNLNPHKVVDAHWQQKTSGWVRITNRRIRRLTLNFSATMGHLLMQRPDASELGHAESLTAARCVPATWQH